MACGADPICGEVILHLLLSSYRIFLKENLSINHFCCQTKLMFTQALDAAQLDKGKDVQVASSLAEASIWPGDTQSMAHTCLDWVGCYPSCQFLSLPSSAKAHRFDIVATLLL